MVIIHGDDIVSSRQKYLDYQKQAALQGKQVISLSGPDLELQNLIQLLNSSSLFGNQHVPFIEDLFSSRPGNEKKKIIAFLKTVHDKEIILFESKDVSPSIKDFPPPLSQKFDLPKYLFRFLDDQNLKTYHLAVSCSPAEQIFALLVGHTRKLIMVKSGFTGFPSWQQSKLLNQTHSLSLDHLLVKYKELLLIDYGEKMSQKPHDLSLSLELWLART